MNEVKLIDTHAHLDFPVFENKLTQVIENANKFNVIKIISISTNLSKIDKIIKISNNFDTVFHTVGVHPNEVGKDNDYKNYDLMVELSNNPKCVGIGEGGLDYHYTEDLKEKQKQSFITQINVARDTNLPLVIHSRDADEDMIKILKGEYKNGPFNAILHCFSSGSSLAKCGLDLGFYVSFSGIVTFNSAKTIQKIAKNIPLDRILVETDSPYLSPEPYRGASNEPKNCYFTAKFISDYRNIDFVEFSHHTYNNAMTVFYRILKWQNDK